MKEDVQQLGEDIVSLSAHIAAATQRLLDMIRRFDEARGWEGDGRTSCADWLNWKTGLAMSTAHEHVRVAHRLAELPRVDEAFARGALSYTKVRAISRVANQHNEAGLVEEALQLTGEQLEQRCRSQADGEVLRGWREPERHVRQRTLGDGTVEICVRLLADEAELVMKAIAEARRELSSAEESRPAEAAQADALMHVVTSWAEGAPAAARRSARTQVLVRLDVSAKGDRARLQDSQHWLSRGAVERLSCDAAVTVVTANGDDVLDVGRSRRTIPPAIARALIARDDGCVFPGCHNRRWLDAHHIEHWSHNGETKLGNLCSLCHRHHMLVHEGGFSIEKTADGVRFRKPDGSLVAATPEPMATTHDPTWLLHMLTPDLAPMPAPA